MQTITVKYLGPTNTLGTRYKATPSGACKSLTITADYSLDFEGNCTAAAKALAEKLGWQGDYIGGHAKDAMVFVNAVPAYTFTTARNEEAAA